MTETKTCSKCRTVKSVDEFHRSKRRKDGRDPHCKACAAARAKDWHARNRQHVLARVSKWQRDNPQRHRESVLRWMQANPRDQIAASEACRSWYLRNKDFLRERSSRRRATVRNAVPAWADITDIRELYREAAKLIADTGQPYHVDHIVPLVSPRLQSLYGNTMPKSKFVGPLLPVVQGLHCEANLRILHARENLRKLNRVWPDMPSYRKV